MMYWKALLLKINVLVLIGVSYPGLAHAQYSPIFAGDTDVPVITLLGAADVQIDCNEEYVDAGATATDLCVGDMTSSIIIGGDVVDTSSLGTYIITYNVSDNAENTAVQLKRTVVVVDSIAPELALLGSSSITVSCGEAYIDAGATATDTCNGDLTSTIVVTNPVNTQVPGTYTVRYNVSDSSSNAAAELTRTVIVQNNCPEGEPGIGTLQVYIGPVAAVTVGAQWRRVGTVTWFISGYEETGIAVGNYQVEFKEVACWTKPNSQNVIILAGDKTTITGTYTAASCEGEDAEGEGESIEGENEGEPLQYGSLQVILEPVAAVEAGAKWRRQGTSTWRESEYIENDLLVGTYNIEFSTVDKWLTPVVKEVVIEADKQTQTKGSYQEDRTCYGEPISISMTDRNNLPGEEILIPINVSSADAIQPAGMQIELIYDPAFLDAATVEVRPTAITGQMSFLANTEDPGQIIITVMGSIGSKGLKGQGRLFDIYAKIRSDIALGTTSKITLESPIFVNTDLERMCMDVDWTATLGTSDTSLLFGDLNGDGETNIIDALYALQVSVGLQESNTDHLITGDLNGDGRINCADSSLLQRLAAGVNLVNPPPVSNNVSDPLLLSNIFDKEVPVTISLDDKTARVGTKFELPVNVDNTQGLGGYDITLNYDPAVLTVVDVIEGTVTGDYPQEWRDKEGTLEISMGRQEALYDSNKALVPGTLAIVTFEVENMPIDSDSTEVKIIDMPALKGQYGDSFDWFVDIIPKSAKISLNPSRCGCRSTLFKDVSNDSVKKEMLGDRLLVGLSMLILLAYVSRHKQL